VVIKNTHPTSAVFGVAPPWLMADTHGPLGLLE